MQKACGIIAISAIALSASQFASAQTSDQSSRLASQSSALRALREEVKNTLRDAGFTNIRIMSESFLVRAINQNGDPVVMVVHPDAHAIVPEASEDQDEANAAGAGDPDSFADLSEDGVCAAAARAHRQIVEADRPAANGGRRGTGRGSSVAKPVGEHARREGEPER